MSDDAARELTFRVMGADNRLHPMSTGALNIRDRSYIETNTDANCTMCNGRGILGATRYSAYPDGTVEVYQPIPVVPGNQRNAKCDGCGKKKKKCACSFQEKGAGIFVELCSCVKKSALRRKQRMERAEAEHKRRLKETQKDVAVQKEEDQDGSD